MESPRRDAGLSVLGSVLLMVSVALINLSCFSLPRHKADIIITLKERYTIQAGSAVNDVGCPAWTITVTACMMTLT